MTLLVNHVLQHWGRGGREREVEGGKEEERNRERCGERERGREWKERKGEREEGAIYHWSSCQAVTCLGLYPGEPHCSSHPDSFQSSMGLWLHLLELPSINEILLRDPATHRGSTPARSAFSFSSAEGGCCCWKALYLPTVLQSPLSWPRECHLKLEGSSLHFHSERRET